MKLLSVWFWEMLENLPLLFGFVIAAHFWDKSLLVGMAALVLGMGLGVFVTQTVEPKLHKEKHEVRWESVLINFLLFVGMSVPIIYYFRANSSWLNWKTDIVAGLAAGILLTFIQSTHWKGAKSRMLLHGAAMIVSIPVIMVGLRYIIRLEDWEVSMFLTILLTLFASLIIALIDYWEMYRQGSGS